MLSISPVGFQWDFSLDRFKSRLQVTPTIIIGQPANKHDTSQLIDEDQPFGWNKGAKQHLGFITKINQENKDRSWITKGYSNKQHIR